MKTLLRHEDIATTSNVYGDLGMDAKRRIQRRLVAFVNEQAKAAEEASRIEAAWKREPITIPISFRDPYLTQVRFLDSRQVQKKNGSPG